MLVKVINGLLGCAKLKVIYWKTKARLKNLNPADKIEFGGKLIDASLDALKVMRTDFGYKTAMDLYVLGSQTVAEGVCRKWAEDMAADNTAKL